MSYSIKRNCLFIAGLFVLSIFIFVIDSYAYYNAPTEIEISQLPRYLELKLRSFMLSQGYPNMEMTNKSRRELEKYTDKLGKSVYWPLHHYPPVLG